MERDGSGGYWCKPGNSDVKPGLANLHEGIYILRSPISRRQSCSGRVPAPPIIFIFVLTVAWRPLPSFVNSSQRDYPKGWSETSWRGFLRAISFRVPAG